MDEKQVWEAYENALKTHNWLYEFEVDEYMWQQGMEQEHNIRDLKKLTDQLDLERSNALYQKYKISY